jgi:glycosyltransferase involved in cell wall biosynthesis
LLYGAFCHCYPPDWRNADTPAAPNFRLHQGHLPSWLVMRRWRHAARHRERLLGPVDIVHSTAYTMPPVSRVKVVVTIHDLSIFVHPDYHTTANYQFVAQNVLHASRRADYIIADSESTRREIVRFLHVPAERIAVIHLAAGDGFHKTRGADEIARIKERYRIRQPYFLAVGSIEPRKNLTRALVAFKTLVETGRVDWQFVLVGGSGWKNESFYDQLRKLGIEDRLVFTGYVPEDDLPSLYQGAEVFVYPSVYEGFGLPVLEAMASGTPVITSNTTSLPEVAGDAALLVEPTDVVQIFKAMDALAGSADLRQALKEKGRFQSKCFSWEKTARETLEVYRRVYGRVAERTGS